MPYGLRPSLIIPLQRYLQLCTPMPPELVQNGPESELSEKEKDELRQLLMAAETLKPKFLSMLTLGPRSIEHDSYAIKARVKMFDSAVEKIITKRGTRQEYGPTTLTDILGIRILCLWPDDISRVLERLITTIRELIGTGLSSFISRDIADVITEVVVYKGPNSPVIYDVIGAQMTEWLEFDPRLSGCVKTEPSPRDRPYSSVHMVLWCRTAHIDNWLPVPVEIQVRTSLEDVWSEVEHRLKYKTQDRGADDRSIQIGHDLLNGLKTQLDVAASTVMSARDLLTTAPPIPGSSVARVVQPLDPLHFWGIAAAQIRLQKQVLKIHSELNDLYANFESNRHPAVAEWEPKFQAMEGNLRRLIDTIEGVPGYAKVDSQQWRFASRMELGQLLFWRSRFARTRAASATDKRALQESDALTELCLKAYLELMVEDAHGRSAMLWFRFGNALLELKGDFDQAHMYLKRAYDELDDDTTIDKESPYRITIPRIYSYCIWRIQNDQFQEAVAQYGMRSTVATYALGQIGLALTNMIPLIKRLEKVRADSGFWNAKHERLRVYNNLISYAWYYALRSCQAHSSERPTQAELVASLKKVIPISVLTSAYRGLASMVPDGDSVLEIYLIHSLAVGAFLTGARRGLRKALTQLKEELGHLESPEAGNKMTSDASQMFEDLEIIEEEGR
jgi:ppGpp synthetase/RelA/SpoT-type nucleotidyltranferase